jgi:hypothetical protein
MEKTPEIINVIRTEQSEILIHHNLLFGIYFTRLYRIIIDSQKPIPTEIVGCQFSSTHSPLLIFLKGVILVSRAVLDNFYYIEFINQYIDLIKNII